MTIEEAVRRRPGKRRTRQDLNREFGKALTMRGAAKASRLAKLFALEGKVPGYAAPVAAYVAREEAAAKKTAKTKAEGNS